MRHFGSKTTSHSSLDRRRTARQRLRQSFVERLELREMLSAVSQPAHVVIVMEENHDYSQIIGSQYAPFINSLAQQGALMTNSTAIEHPSEPNYLDLFSGSNQGVYAKSGFTGDELPTQFPGISLPFTTPNLGAELLKAGDTFVSYAESLPYAGYDSLDTTTQGNSGNYARRHNPAVNWTDPNNPGGNLANNVMPTSVNQPFTSFPTDFNQLPTVSLVVPNVADDMHDDPSPTGIQKADTWLQNNLGAYAAWAQKNDSLLIVTWDENDDSAGNHIPTIFFGPMVQFGKYTEAINHFNVLRTVEDLYGLPHAGASATAAPITDIFTPLLAAGSTVAATFGTTFTGTLATFTDADGDNNANDFTATIDWGDGSGSSGGTLSGGASGFTITGSHNYTSKGIYTATVTINDTDGQTRTIKAEVLAEPSALYVTAVYQDVLGRGPDSGGLVFWTHSLDSGAPISSVAAQIGHSAEYYQNFVIKPAYLSLLGRPADGGGLQHWTTQMLAGLTDQGLEAGFISSDEFYTNAGGTDLDWVDAVYLKLLARSADHDGETFWTGQLATLEMTQSAIQARSQVAVRISSSQENNTNLINDDYQHYLGRGADPDGLNYWLTQFSAGQTNEDVIAGFTGSAEYYKDKTGVSP